MDFTKARCIRKVLIFWLFVLSIITLNGFYAGLYAQEDSDQDGIPDSIEHKLMIEFAPVVYLHPNDKYRPSSIEWYLARTQLRFDHGSGCPDHQVPNMNKGRISVDNLIQQTHRNSRLMKVDLSKLLQLKSPVYICSDTGSLEYSGRASGSETPFFLQIPNDEYEKIVRRGDFNSSIWPCYSHVMPSPSHHPFSYDIQYFFFYPYNGDLDIPAFPDKGSHEGDWEHITVRVDKISKVIHSIYYSAHDDEGRWYFEGSSSSQGYKTSVDSNPIVYSAINSHASYPWSGRWKRDGFPDDEASISGRIWKCADNYKNVGEIQAHPESMKWIQYSGRWGEIGENFSGPYGPAFQEWFSGDPLKGDEPHDHKWIFVAQEPKIFGRSRTGAWNTPLQEFTHAAEFVKSQNKGDLWTVIVRPGIYNSSGVYATKMKILAPEGDVLLR